MSAIEGLGISREEAYAAIERGVIVEKGGVISEEESEIIADLINNNEEKVNNNDLNTLGESVPVPTLNEEEMKSLLIALTEGEDLPESVQERLNKECLVSDKINELKRSIKNASDEELEFLSINLDNLIDTMMQNEKVKKDYENHKTLKKILGINNYEHKD